MNKYVVDLYTEKGRKENLSGLIVGIVVSLVFIIVGFILLFTLKQLMKKVFAIIFAFIGCWVLSTSIISLIVSNKRKKKIEELIRKHKKLLLSLFPIQQTHQNVNMNSTTSIVC